MKKMPGEPREPGRRSLFGLELRCPPLPQTLLEALDLMEKPAVMEVGPVAEMVQRDPIVVARLLHTVNSAYYGLRHTISSADRAVVMLGPVAVAGIVLGMHMLKLRSILDGPASGCFHRLIRHSIATAFLTRHLVEGTPREAVRGARRQPGGIGVSFTAGLLHDFGKIILVYNFSDEAVALYDKDAFAPHIAAGDERDLEQLLFGCDHSEAGEFAARKFNFPDLLTDVMRLHHDPDRIAGATEPDRLIRATAAADRASKAMGYAFTRPLTWDELQDDPVWELLRDDLHPRYETAAHLVADLQEQREHLDAYVEHLTGASDSELTMRRIKSVRPL